MKKLRIGAGSLELSGDQIIVSKLGAKTAVSVQGAVARLVTRGQDKQRVTATRVGLLGLFAFAFPKKQERAETVLEIDLATGDQISRKVEPMLRGQAQKFADALNAAARGGRQL